MSKKELFELAHTRVASQKARMEECTRLEICPFCWKNLAIYHDAPILKQGRFWVITANDHPYTGARYHYLAIYRDHVSTIGHLDPESSHELFRLFSNFCEERRIEGATIVMRFGEMVYTGATIRHLHAHIVSGASREEVPNPKYPESFITPVVGYKVPK